MKYPVSKPRSIKVEIHNLLGLTATAALFVLVLCVALVFG